MRREGVEMRALVASAGKHGATNEIAIEIGRTLTDHGVDTEVLDVEDVSALDGFDAVILGSAVYIGHWLKPATKFAEAHTDELRARPTWLFSSGPIGDPPRPPQEQEAGKADKLLVTTGAREHRVFAGKIDKGQLSFPERAVVRTVGAAEGDYRDWNEIRAWATDIATALTSES
jgi:menaquinone-dependent protoporphyrinogen oxidase